ncbi:MAG TPA: ECF-type sigma factor [Gemmatimonadaceae bacterium]|jgi:RNA polymerase sigma factor (TIGR02999 family)
MAAPPDVTTLLMRWSEGDQDALPQLIPLVYQECRSIAARHLASRSNDLTLQPTALVHELYLKLVDQRHASWKNREQFLAISAQIIRRILVDHARAKMAARRDWRLQVTLDNSTAAADPDTPALLDIIALDEALEKLGARDKEQQRIVELRFFAGFSVEEIAALVGRSPRTVKREWQLAKAWLFRELK